MSKDKKKHMQVGRVEFGHSVSIPDWKQAGFRNIPPLVDTSDYIVIKQHHVEAKDTRIAELEAAIRGLLSQENHEWHDYLNICTCRYCGATIRDDDELDAFPHTEDCAYRIASELIANNHDT